MIAVQPAVVERDYTPIATAWQSKISVGLLKTLIDNSKQGAYFTFDNKDRLIVYRNHYDDRLGTTWDIVYQKYVKSVNGSYVIFNEERYSAMIPAFEGFIKRLNSKDPSKVNEKKAA